VSICFGPVASGLGALATTLKRYDEAEAYLSGALRSADELGMPFVRALVQRQFAAMLIERNQQGDRKRARQMIDEIVRFGEENNYLGIGSIAAKLRAQITARAR
jgi:hypothetical protein